MDMIGRIRRLHSRGNKSEREIARLTGLSRNTVAKWLKAPAETVPKYRRKAAVTKLTPFHETLKQALRADARRPVAARRTAKALYAEVKAAGYAGGYTRVKDFIREWRAGEGQGAAARAFVPLTFALGEAFQFDWSEEGHVVGGVYHPDLHTRAFFSSLYSEAERIAIGRAGKVAGALADQLLCTDWFDKSHTRRNRSKLTVVAPAKRKWVMALCLLPECLETAADESSRKAVNLFTQLGASVHLPVDVLEAGFAACPEAHSWHRAGQKVLMLGLVRSMPRKASKGEFIGFVKHLALIPLHQRYVPVPSTKHVTQLEGAIGRRDSFVVEAEDDPHLKRSQ